MSQAAARISNAAPGITPVVAHDQLGFLERHHFLFRRLHSLTGIMPVGVFVIFHLFTNAQMALGDFQHEVNFIHNLPALLFLEIFGLWLPIAFHAGLGVVYIFTGRRNTGAYPYGSNWRYTLQRWTAWISLFFIFYHVATLRWGWVVPGLTEYPFIAAGIDDQPLAHATTALALQGGPLGGWLNVLLYVIGVYSVIFHWANGLWTAAITWGLTLTVDSQRRWGYFCIAMGVGLSIFAAMAIYAARTHVVTPEEEAAIKAYVEQLNRGEVPAELTHD